MKTLASLILMASVCFGMGAETIESLHICKNSSDTYLVTISNNETEGRAIWIDHYELLVGDNPSLLIPIQDKKSFKADQFRHHAAGYDRAAKRVGVGGIRVDVRGARGTGAIA